LLVIGGVAGFLYTKKHDKAKRDILILNNRRIFLEVADTDAKRVQGLSGRDDLPKGSAMLFAFPESSRQCMWMKDMNFSLDMVWLDGSKRITKVKESVAPSTYPESFCADNAKYVLEFNVGTIKENNLKVGQNLNF